MQPVLRVGEGDLDPERAYVALRPVHVALGGELGLGRDEAHAPLQLLARSQPHRQHLPDEDAVHVALFDFGPDPYVVEVDDGHDGIALPDDLEQAVLNKLPLGTSAGQNSVW